MSEEERRKLLREMGSRSLDFGGMADPTNDARPDPVVAYSRKTREPITASELPDGQKMFDRLSEQEKNNFLMQGASTVASVAGAGMTGGTAPMVVNAVTGLMNMARPAQRSSASRAQMGGEAGNVLFNMLSSKVPAPLRGIVGQVSSGLAGTAAEQSIEGMLGTVTPKERTENVINEGVLPAALGGTLGGFFQQARDVNTLRKAFGEDFTYEQMNKLGLAANLKLKLARSVNNVAGAFGGFKARRDHQMIAASLERMEEMGYVPNLPATVSEAVERASPAAKGKAGRSVQSTVAQLKGKMDAFSEDIKLSAPDATGRVKVARTADGKLVSLDTGGKLPKSAKAAEISVESFNKARAFLDDALENPKQMVKLIGTTESGTLSDDAIEAIQTVANPAQKAALANAYVRHHFIGPALSGTENVGAFARESVEVGPNGRSLGVTKTWVGKTKRAINPVEAGDSVILNAKRLAKNLASEDMDERRVGLMLGGGEAGKQRLDSLRVLARVLDENSIGAQDSTVGRIVSYTGNKVIWQLGFGGLAGAGVLGPQIAAGAVVVGGVGTIISAVMNSPVLMSSLDGAVRNPETASRFVRQLIQTGALAAEPQPNGEILLVDPNAQDGTTQTVPNRAPRIQDLLRNSISSR